MSNSYDWENNKKIYKKVHYMNFWEKKLFYKKQQTRWLLLSVIESSIQK